MFQVATKRNPALRDCITICHCDSSLAENPAIFRHITETAKFKTFKIPRHVRDIWAEDASGGSESALLVTGDPADMMFGTYVMAQCILDPPNLKKHGHGCQMAIARFFRSYVFGPSGFWTMAPLRYAAQFDPFPSFP